MVRSAIAKNGKYILVILHLLSENDVVKEKVEQLKTWIEQSKHTVFYTGAGVRICLSLVLVDLKAIF